MFSEVVFDEEFNGVLRISQVYQEIWIRDIWNPYQTQGISNAMSGTHFPDLNYYYFRHSTVIFDEEFIGTVKSCRRS
jgi:hypothetical protein